MQHRRDQTECPKSNVSPAEGCRNRMDRVSKVWRITDLLQAQHSPAPVFEPRENHLSLHSSLSELPCLSSEQLSALPIISPIFTHFLMPTVTLQKKQWKDSTVLYWVCTVFLSPYPSNISAIFSFSYNVCDLRKFFFSKCTLLQPQQWLVFFCRMSC